jgi:hypothetical protein
LYAIFLDELANYIQCSSIESLDKEKSLHQMLISFKNSMTDGHIVNQKFVKILEEWREQILPLHWENLDDKKMPILCQLNKFSLPNLSPPDSTFSHSLILDSKLSCSPKIKCIPQ